MTAPIEETRQESYAPPTQQSSTPPTQQSYAPPTQESYTPPTQQSAAQPAYAQAAQTPKQKKPANKTVLFIIGGVALIAIIAVVLILVLGGKGGDAVSDDPNLGVYTAASAEMMGMEMNITDMFAGGVTIELKANGKCALDVDGTKGNGTWTLKDGVFHVSGSGLDCDGTLANGVMTLDNMLGMGLKLTFAKEGGFSSGDVGDTGTNAPIAALTSGAPSELQKQWNGTWYGCIYVSEATGEMDAYVGGRYDAYMVVEVDANGNGEFAVYIDGGEEAFARAVCEAKAEGLYAVEGTVAGGADMYAYNWMFLPMPDYKDQYVMSDSIEDANGKLDFSLYMKQWGGSWQAEIDSDFAIVPPSVESYAASVENGELPPYGFAPIEYEGSAVPAGIDGGADMSGISDDGYGQSEADADGIVSLDMMIAAGKYCDAHRTEVIYDDVYNMMGYIHGAPQTDTDNWQPGVTHMYLWSTGAGEYIYITFSVADNGYEYWQSMSYSSGLLD